MFFMDAFKYFFSIFNIENKERNGGQKVALIAFIGILN